MQESARCSSSCISCSSSSSRSSSSRSSSSSISSSSINSSSSSSSSSTASLYRAPIASRDNSSIASSCIARCSNCRINRASRTQCEQQPQDGSLYWDISENTHISEFIPLVPTGCWGGPRAQGPKGPRGPPSVDACFAGCLCPYI